jgi:hypothetical protein
MKKSLLIFVLGIACLTMISCQKENPVVLQEQNVETNKVDIGDCEATEVALMAGQTINSGTVTVSNDADYIYVTYTATNGWLITQTHLYAGACALVPVNNAGNPSPGQFPYKTTHNYATSYTYQIPIGTIGNCGCIAAHAVVVKLGTSGQIIEQQTGWGNGVRINPNGGNWGMKFEYCTCIPTAP